MPCIQNGFPRLLATLSANLATIYSGINRAAPYHHEMVAVTYYSANYADPLGTLAISLLDETIATATRAAGGRVADGFGAFASIAASKGGDSCAAGLLVRLSATTCDVHPSALGQEVLARAIRQVLPPDLNHEPAHV